MVGSLLCAVSCEVVMSGFISLKAAVLMCAVLLLRLVVGVMTLVLVLS